MSTRTSRELARWAFLASMAAGTLLIARASLPYYFGDELHEFLVEKLPLPHEGLWLSALHLHVPAALFSLPACLALLSPRLLRARPRAHAWLGRATGAVVLLALVPSGAWLALYAKGGLPGTAGFLLSDALVAFAMVRAIATARARDFAAHRRWVLHLVAQLSVAVTSRALLVALDLLGMEGEVAYLLALWGPVLLSALIAECLAGPAGVRRSHENRPARLALDPGL